VLVGLLTVLYVRKASGLVAPIPKIPSPSAEFEVDPTRWRHNGEQPVWTQNGNQSHIIDEQSASMIGGFS